MLIDQFIDDTKVSCVLISQQSVCLYKPIPAASQRFFLMDGMVLECGTEILFEMVLILNAALREFSSDPSL